MAEDTNNPRNDSSGAKAIPPPLPAPNPGARTRWRAGRIAALALGIALGGWLISEVFIPPKDPVEREVARIVGPVRRAERDQKPFHRFIQEISRWVFRDDNSNSNRPDPHEELEKLGERAEPILIRYVKTDASPAVRKLAIEFLALAGVTNAFPTITGALEDDRDDDVRAAAARALVQLDPSASGRPLLAALAREKEPHDSGSPATFNYPRENDVRSAIVRALGEIDAAVAFEPLMHVLQNDASAETRSAAATSLGQLRDPRAAPALRALLATNEHNLRISVIQTLGGLRDREAVPQLLALMEFVNTNTAAIRGGPRLETEAANPPIPSWQFDSIRQAIAEALGRIGDARATETLIRAVPNLANDSEVQTFLDALGALGDPKAVPTIRAVIADRPKLATHAAQALTRLGHASATQELIALLDAADRETRVAAAVALANLGERAAVTNLLEAMTAGPQQDSKRNIVEALGIVGDAAAVPLLIEALKDPNEDVRTQAAWALGNIGDQGAIDALIRALKDSEFGARFAAAFALVGMTNAAALPALEALLTDEERRVRTAAACSLAFHGSERAIPELQAALKRSDDWQRFAAVMALLWLNTPAARQLARHATSDRNTGVQQLAVSALENGPVAALVGVLKNGTDDHRHYAARMLLFFDDPAAAPALREALHDPKMEVRVAARVALRRLERGTGRK